MMMVTSVQEDHLALMLQQIEQHSFHSHAAEA
jgi:hypothetical protein